MLKHSGITQTVGMTQSYILRIYHPSTVGEEQTDYVRCALIDSHTGESQTFSGLTMLFHQLVEEVTQEKYGS